MNPDSYGGIHDPWWDNGQTDVYQWSLKGVSDDGINDGLREIIRALGGTPIPEQPKPEKRTIEQPEVRVRRGLG